jgi:hypothetical protein
MMDDNLTNKSGYLNNNGRQRMPKQFDRNGLKNLTHLHQVDKQFTEYVINLIKLGPSAMLQKVADWSVLPPRKMKC